MSKKANLMLYIALVFPNIQQKKLSFKRMVKKMLVEDFVELCKELARDIF